MREHNHPWLMLWILFLVGLMMISHSLVIERSQHDRIEVLEQSIYTTTAQAGP